ncbi:hypothetical protein B0H13DRAFT_2328642 [Mycena leptocephala]|nr:hypothetical protein B0H13DRAFT_2328642 [Mycena leptocephala]
MQSGALAPRPRFPVALFRVQWFVKFRHRSFSLSLPMLAHFALFLTVQILLYAAANFLGDTRTLSVVQAFSKCRIFIATV